MGMDLIPKNKSAREFHANIDQWQYIADVLDLAGVDYYNMRFTNDGDYVPSNTAKEWARAIRAYLRENAELKTPDSHYEGGYKTRPVGAKRTSGKDETSVDRMIGLRIGDTGLSSGLPKDFFSSSVSDSQFYHGGQITKLEPVRKRELLKFSRWLDRSGGFYQW